MSEFNYVIAFLQVLAGVNFAFILGDFLEKFLSNLLKTETVVANSANKFKNKWTLAEVSLKSLQPIESVSGGSTKFCIEEVRKKGTFIKAEIDRSNQKLFDFQERVKQQKGFQTLFLIVSLYCIVALGYLALNTHCVNLHLCLWAICFTTGSVIQFLVETIKVLSGRFVSNTKENIKALLLQIIFFIIAIVVNVVINKISISNCVFCKIDDILFYGIFIFPMMALLVGGGYALICYGLMAWKTKKTEKNNQNQIDDLLKDCDKLLEMQKLFQPISAPTLEK